MKESEGVWRSTWLPHKIIILQNEELFKKIAGDYGFDATEFIDKLNKELTKVEDFLSSSNPNIKNEQAEETAMKPIDRSLEILNVIDNIKPSSQGMHAYVNSLSKEDYALLATTFDLGRQGWERGYYETREYEDYVERMAANGEQVTREMADMKFLPKNKKQEQFDWLYQHMFKKSNKYDGACEHNWLSMKTNLISETRKGIDCSGFVQRTFREQFGLELPRSTYEQQEMGKSISRNSLRTGDLVLFRAGSTGRHVGIYIGNDQFVHASTSSGVTISSMNEPYWKKRYNEARRVLTRS